MIKLSSKVLPLLKLSTACFLLSLAIILPAQAATRTINLRIEGVDKNIIDTNLELPEQCTIINAGTSHTFNGYKAICALKTAQEQGLLTFQTNDFGWGLFIDSINGIGGEESMFWALYKDNGAASVGVSDLELQQTGDKIPEMIMSYVNWNYINEVLEVGLSKSAVRVDTKVLLTAKEWKNDKELVDLNAPATFFIDDQVYVTETGTLEYTPNTLGSVTIYVEAKGKTRSAKKILIVGTTDIDNISSNTGGDEIVFDYNFFKVPEAINYLNSQQKEDGSFGNILNTDWAAIAYGAYGQESENKNKLRNYLLTDPDTDGGPNPISNSARRAMALMSLDINPYTGTPTNYVQKIIDYYNGTQYFTAEYPDEYNDDIFAVLSLLKAGYTINDPQIFNPINFIVSKQAPNGSWGGADLTSATIQMLKSARTEKETDNILYPAHNYLTNIQQTDGSFGNTFSTSWAIQAGVSLDESKKDWTRKANNFLYTKQLANGSINDDIWATTEAIPAALNKNWPQILKSFEKITILPTITTSTYPILLTTTTPNITTTTLAISTSTLDIVTTTPPIMLSTTTPDLATNTASIVLGEKIIQKDVIMTPPTAPAPRTIKPTTNKTEIQQLNNNPIPTEITKVEKSNELINSLPLDTPPTRKAAKKIAMATGGSALVVGLYLGFRLLKNVV